MKQEQKELLLEDLCARLPYGVRCNYYDCCEGDYDNGTICGFERREYIQIDGVCIHIEEVKPYLLPLSSMTEEQKEELLEITDAIKIDDTGIYYEEGDTLETYLSKIPYTFMCKVVTWCYKNHLDINNLIPLGLAINATGLNIY